VLLEEYHQEAQPFGPSSILYADVPLNRVNRTMLDRVQWSVEDERDIAPGAQAAPQGTIGIQDIWNIFVRQWKVIIGLTLACIALSIVALLLWPVRYTAIAQLIIDPARVEVAQNYGLGERQADTLAVETQVEVGRSGNVLQSVVTKLNLIDDPEFGVREEGGELRPGRLEQLKEQISTAFGLESATTETAKTSQDEIQATIEKLRRSLGVRRVGATNVFEIEVKSRSRTKAATIANAVAEEYLADQIRARTEAIDKANKWLDERLVAIRSEAQGAEDALQEFRARNKGSSSSATLLDLEAQAQSYRKLYESFLDRHIATDQQISFPSVNARVITRATPPQRKSEPKTLLVLAAGAAIGGLIGATVGFARERLSRKFRSANDVSAALGVPCLGAVPDAGRTDLSGLYDRDAHETSHRSGSDDEEVRRKLELLGLTIASEVNARTTAVLAITSRMRGEGVTTVATAVAYSIAGLGKKVLLIDANLEAPELSSSMAQKTEYAQGTGTFGGGSLQVIHRSHRPSPEFIPASAISEASDLNAVINSSRNGFDYVIVDAPSMENGTDIFPAIMLSDAVILVLDAATSTKARVSRELQAWSFMNGRILGVVLNRVSTKLTRD
jgi:uncharacterized protein involved in exopolysaccharide biosynthesis/Mrp family chromosome partitioning ATPase